ncbi:DNRLRE domain-containing protein [Aeromonas schubertii]
MNLKKTTFLLPLVISPYSIADSACEQLSTLTRHIAPVSDTYISSGKPNISFEREEILRVSSKDDPTPHKGTKRILIKFDTSDISHIKIKKVSLRLWQSDGAVVPELSVYTVTSPWEESSVTWETQPLISDKIAVAKSKTGYIDIESDKTQEVFEKWIYDEKSNHGIEIRVSNENYNSGTSGLWGDSIGSIESQKAAQLIVEYSTQDNVEYIDSSSISDINNNGSPELVVMGKNFEGAIKTCINDMSTGENINEISFFDKNWLPISVSSHLSESGTPIISVLAKNKVTGRFQAELREAIGGQIHNVINY